MAKLKTTREMIDEARGAGAEADTLEVGVDAAKLSEPRPLTAEEQAKLTVAAQTLVDILPAGSVTATFAAQTLRWAATVDYWQERAKNAEAQLMLARMHPECESKCERAAGEIERLQARIAELRVDRDVLRGRSPFATPTVEALQARVAELEAEIAKLKGGTKVICDKCHLEKLDTECGIYKNLTLCRSCWEETDD